KSRDVTSIVSLLPFFGTLTLSEISTELISDYREERLKKVKPATIYQELALMRRMYNVARKEWKWVNDNPVADLSFSVGNSNARDRWLTVEEEQRLLEAASPEWVKEIIVFALNTGMRRGEILNLEWKDLDFSRRLITVQKSKNGEKRSIPMSNIILVMLKDRKIIDIGLRVFSVTETAMRMGFDRALNKANIENFHFHDLRHTFATRLVQNSVDLYKVKELLGHKSIQMTVRYAHHCTDSLRSGIDILDKCYNSVTVGKKGIDIKGGNPLKSTDALLAQ
ncbi:MAG: site-specific integrase, partial [Nitrospirae bacterium]|nr:site-specific integrase [Nitrospirota bacterium]